jgi:hypothetical protein
MVSEKFSTEHMVESFENYYLQLAEAKKRRGGLLVSTGIRRKLAEI